MGIATIISAFSLHSSSSVIRSPFLTDFNSGNTKHNLSIFASIQKRFTMNCCSVNILLFHSLPILWLKVATNDIPVFKKSRNHEGTSVISAKNIQFYQTKFIRGVKEKHFFTFSKMLLIYKQHSNYIDVSLNDTIMRTN
jgi:hypothetical protein